MPFGTSWHTLLEECDALGADATLTTPLTDTRFRITSTQDPRIVIEFVDTGDSQPLQRDHFDAMAHRCCSAVEVITLLDFIKKHLVFIIDGERDARHMQN